MSAVEQSSKRFCKRTSFSEGSVCSHPSRTDIIDLPQELLAKIIRTEDITLARWTALASVCKEWKHTLQLVSTQEAQ